MRGKDKEEISPERVLQVKEAFVEAMRCGNVSEESIKAIRQELGIPTELDVNATPEARAKMLTARYTPLTRTQTRNLLDRYAEGGRGFGPNAGAGITAKDLAKAEHTRNLSGSDKTTRMNVNMENIVKALGKKLEIDIEDAGGAVAMEIDGVDVVLQDAGELLLMRAEVGELPGGGEGEILAAAMRANFLYQGTGGATLAVNPADGRLHVHKYNWMERLDAGFPLGPEGDGLMQV